MNATMPGRYRPEPMAQQIALALLANRDVLRLRAWRLIRDVRARYLVGRSTALHAVVLATENAHGRLS